MSNSEIHLSHCDVWELNHDEINFKASPPKDYSSDTEIYLSYVRPVYDSLGRVMAQLSGVFLLYLTGSEKEIPLDHNMLDLARRKIFECRERLLSINVPSQAMLHHEAVSNMCAHLHNVSICMDKIGLFHKDLYRNPDVRLMIKELHEAQRKFIEAAEPDANLSPVDFSHACCSCGVSKGA